MLYNESSGTYTTTGAEGIFILVVLVVLIWGYYLYKVVKEDNEGED